MPDPLLKTISATQSAGLFGVSPYVTRWMLYQHFANGIVIDSPADSRMSWGKKLQPLVLAEAAEHMRLEVFPNADDTYVRRGKLGCTRDGTIVCPDRGPGAVETKCVFDYRTWMADWQGGKSPPRMHEIQLQHQMHVGDGTDPYRWGLLVAWVAGEQHYFERNPIGEFTSLLEAEATKFFADVEQKHEPDPFGATIEMDLIKQIFPTYAGKVIDLSGELGAEAHSEIAALYNFQKETENAAAGEAERLRAKISALVKDAEKVLLPGGVNITCTTTKNGQRRIKVYVPQEYTPTHPPQGEPPIEAPELLYAG